MRGLFFVFAIILLPLCSSLNVLSTRAETLPGLQEGLAVRYEEQYVYKLSAEETSSEMRYFGTVNIRVLDVDRLADRTRVSYDGSFTVVFFPWAKSSSVEAVNLDGTPSAVSTQASLETGSWSFASTVTLKGRNAIAIEGDRVDIVNLRVHGEQWEGDVSTLCDWTTFFPLNYPTTVFLSAGMSRGDQVPSYKIDDPTGTAEDWNPRIWEESISISGVSAQTTPFGNRDIVIGEKHQKSDGWNRLGTYSWDRKTGVLVEYKQTGDKQKEQYGLLIHQATEYSLRLAEVQAPPEAATTSTYLPIEVLLGIGTVGLAAALGVVAFTRRKRPTARYSAVTTAHATTVELYEISVSVSSVGKTVTLEVASDHTVDSLVETLVSTLDLPKGKAYAVEHAGRLISQSDFGKSIGALGIGEGSKLTLRDLE